MHDKVVMLLGPKALPEKPKSPLHRYTLKNSEIVIDDANVNMVVEVIDALHLTGIEEDNLVYGFIKSYTIGKNAMLTIE